jgi:ABC-type glycerol-3-phosphate transport system substrate-binding protein
MGASYVRREGAKARQEKMPMKKIVSIAFAVVAISAVLAGCSKPEEAATPDAGTSNTAPSGSETPTTPQ